MSSTAELVVTSAWVTGLVLAFVLVARLVMRRALGSGFVYTLWTLPLVACIATLVLPRPAAPRILLSESALISMSAELTAVDATDPLIIFWLTGCAIMLVWQVRLRKSARNRAATIHLGWSGDIELVSSAEQVNPMATGLWRKQIVLPDGFERLFTPRQRKFIVDHEVAHHKRHDIAANALAQTLRCVFWFHPMVHIAYRYFRNDQELAIDALLLRGATQAERRAYGDALLKTAEHSSVADVGWSSARRMLAQRMRSLSAQTPSRRLERTGVTILIVLVTSAAATGWHALPAQPPVFIDAREATATLPALSPEELAQNVMFAVRTRDETLLNRLLSHKAATNYRLPNVGTPLMVAARQGDLNAAKTLVAHGADVNAAVLTAGSPLIVAAKHNHIAVAQFLIEAGSDVNAHVFLDETPLINAARFGHSEMAQTLINNGADTDKTVTTFSITHLPLGTKSPMSEARRLNHADIVQLLAAN